MTSVSRATAPRIALVHAVAEAIAPINDAFAAHWPEARTFNLLDDSLSGDLAARGAIDDALTARFIALSHYCVSSGADAVQFTCSAFNQCIEAAQEAIDIPVLKADAAMIETAFTHGPRLGAVVTFAPAVDALAAQVDAFASMMGVHPQLDIRLAQGALEALRAGDVDEHDQRIAQAVAQPVPLHRDFDCFSGATKRADARRASAGLAVLIQVSATRQMGALRPARRECLRCTPAALPCLDIARYAGATAPCWSTSQAL